MTRFKMLTLGALMGAAALSVAAATPVPSNQQQASAKTRAACPECFPIPPVCEPTEPCPEAGK